MPIESREFRIFYSDLTEVAQDSLCELFQTMPQEENWDIESLAELMRDVEVENNEPKQKNYK